MSWPPMLMHIRIKNKDTKFGLWLPLFLLFPIALVIFIILSPFILIGVIVLWNSGWGRMALFALRAAFVACWSLRGLKVDVRKPDEFVSISII
ncbi:MAG: hypothetical protein JXA17_00140 [Dehalococcoidales bacterium]|nr:hypothetical protein [Dehalococcoidales bacterium]